MADNLPLEIDADLLSQPEAVALQNALPAYELLGFLGRGGMGAVYKARQRSLNRLVAIKLLNHLHMDGLDFAARFKQEACTLAHLAHPGIVSVHDFGEAAGGLLYFVMEYVEGMDLAQIIELKGPMPPEEILSIFRQIGAAMIYAHGKNVIHRDLKPANVLIRSNGEVKVADFGLAKITVPGTVALTASSISMGSRDFAAPEVFVKGGEADHRADIYSLGVMLYQMLTGAIPRGMFKLPSQRVPGLDHCIDEVVCKALEQEREDRYQSVGEMMDDLEMMMPSPVSQTIIVADALELPVARQRVLSRMAGTAALLGGIAAAYFLWAGLERNPRSNPAQHQAADQVPKPHAAAPAFVPLPETPVEFQGHRYQYVPGAFTWTEAQANAVSLGGHLVTLTSEAENRWVWSQFSKYLPPLAKRPPINRGWWAGGSRSLEGAWTWVTGEPFDYACWAATAGPAARTPRLRHHDNGGGGSLSAWTAMHYSDRCGFVVEWDSMEAPAGRGSEQPDEKTLTDVQQRHFATWLFQLPPSTDPAHAGLNLVPDLLVEGWGRNLRKTAELPVRPFSITRVRTGPLRVDAEAVRHLSQLALMPKLCDLRFYGIEDGFALSYLRASTELRTLVFRGVPGQTVLEDKEVANLAPLSKLGLLRLEGWLSFTGKGLGELKGKHQLQSLGLTDCPDLTDEGVAEICRFKNLRLLGLTVGAGVTDQGLALLGGLPDLEELTLNFADKTTATGSGLKALAAARNLRVLRLGANPGAVLNHVGALTSLEELHCIHNPTVTDASLAGLASLTSLHLLRLDDTSITGKGFAGFKNFNNRLQLRVDDCLVSNEGLRVIIAAFPELDSIALSLNKSTFDLAIAIQDLSRLPKLTRLHCVRGFKDTHLPVVAGLRNISSLSLQDSEITEGGLVHLKRMAGLTDLSLTSLPFTDECLPALQELGALRKLDLTGTKITKHGAAALKKTLPGCEIKL